MKYQPTGHSCLTLILLTSTIWQAPTNASKWRMGFNSAFNGLIRLLNRHDYVLYTHDRSSGDNVGEVNTLA